MIASENSSSAHSSDKSNAYPLRWEGHMANDVGNTVGVEPCAVLSVNTDEIWLKGTLGDFHIPRSAVTKIGRGGMYPWVFMCVRIRHNIPNVPWLLQFKPLTARSRDVIAQIKSLGYPTG
jgi:hypothetical protein